MTTPEFIKVTSSDGVALIIPVRNIELVVPIGEGAIVCLKGRPTKEVKDSVEEIFAMLQPEKLWHGLELPEIATNANPETIGESRERFEDTMQSAFGHTHFERREDRYTDTWAVEHWLTWQIAAKL